MKLSTIKLKIVTYLVYASLVQVEPFLFANYQVLLLTMAEAKLLDQSFHQLGFHFLLPPSVTKLIIKTRYYLCGPWDAWEVKSRNKSGNADREWGRPRTAVVHWHCFQTHQTALRLNQLYKGVSDICHIRMVVFFNIFCKKINKYLMSISKWISVYKIDVLKLNYPNFLFSCL